MNITRQGLAPAHRRAGGASAGDTVRMAALVVALCVGMIAVVLAASAIGGPVAWTVAVLVMAGLALAHLKLMDHGRN